MSDPDAALADAGRLAATLTDPVAALMRQAAAKVLLPRFRTLSADEQEQKSVGELVTVADRECEALMGEGLSNLLPDASIVGEEASHTRPDLLDCLGDPLCWIVDPLDGTGYYAEGRGPFGIMIALASGGRTIGGWILDPLSDRLCWAAAGAGCWIDGRRMSAGSHDGSRPNIGISPLLRRRPERSAAVDARLAGHFALVEIPRCAAAHYPAILTDGPPLTLYERTLAWDHAPGALMIEEAGGKCARIDGSPYLVSEDRIGLLVATSPGLWDKAAALLQDLPN